MDWFQWTGFYMIGTSVMKELIDPHNYRPISFSSIPMSPSNMFCMSHFNGFSIYLFNSFMTETVII